MPRMLETMRETFWILALAVIVLFAFFVALGAFSPRRRDLGHDHRRAAVRPLGRPRVLEGRRARPPRPVRRCAHESAAASSAGDVGERHRLGTQLRRPRRLRRARPRDPADRRRDGGRAGPARAPRAGRRRRARRTRPRPRCMSGPGPEVAEVRELEAARSRRARSAIRVFRRRRRRRRAAAARRLRARRRLGRRDARLVRPGLPRAGERVGRRDREHRLPARARAPVPGRARGRARGGALAGRARGASWARIPSRLAIAGDSAGGNLATVTARRLRDEGGPAAAHAGADLPGLRQRAQHALLPRERRRLRAHRARA